MHRLDRCTEVQLGGLVVGGVLVAVLEGEVLGRGLRSCWGSGRCVL
jgi:hypothetical protein